MGLELKDAFDEALKQRGTASVFTAVTMTISVATWMFSALKFQADMGILLAFMFLVNMFGAILLLPALAAYLVGDRLRASSPHGVEWGDVAPGGDEQGIRRLSARRSAAVGARRGLEQRDERALAAAHQLAADAEHVAFARRSAPRAFASAITKSQ